MSPEQYSSLNQKNVWEVIVRVVIAALSAALTAITTTSCMGHGPF